jgi:hypothetical protein
MSNTKYSDLLNEMVREGRGIWRDLECSPAEALEFIAVTVGQIAEVAMTYRTNGGYWSEDDRLFYGRLLGDLVATCVRLIDDYDMDPGERVIAALAVQRGFTESLREKPEQPLG